MKKLEAFIKSFYYVNCAIGELDDSLYFSMLIHAIKGCGLSAAEEESLISLLQDLYVSEWLKNAKEAGVESQEELEKERNQAINEYEGYIKNPYPIK